MLRSLARGRDLTKGSRWPLLGLWLIFVAIEIGMGFAEASRTLSIGATPRFLLDALIPAADSVVVAMFMAASYVELRQVKEGTGADELTEIFA